jgi:Haem-binding domain
MSRRLSRSAVVFAAAFVAAQLVRPNRTNPATDATRTIQAQAGTPSELGGVLDRACRDCHSNGTVWPGIARVAPVSWLMAFAVTKGRRAVNFSEWAAYSPEQRRVLLALSCQDASDGKMPGVYARVRPETQLSPRDVETICAAASGVKAYAGGMSR